MKVTDYMSRPGLIENYLIGKNLIGAEIGVDVGAHAESMLNNCRIDMLYLIDPWDREFNYGYCIGRLHSKGYKNQTDFIRKRADQSIDLIENCSLDFIYFDAEHDYAFLKRDFKLWFEKLKVKSILSFRGYSFEGVKKVVDEILSNKNYTYENSEYLDEVVIFINKYM